MSALAPRFDLDFADGEARLSAASAIDVAEGATIDSLHLSLGRFEGRVDLREGAERFRHRRTKLLSARIRLSLRALEAWAAEASVSLRLSIPGEDMLRVEMPSGFGVTFRMEALEGALVARSPAPLPEGSLAAAALLGFDASEEGALRLERPLRPLLILAFATRGWRVPDERSCAFGLTLADGHAQLTLRQPD